MPNTKTPINASKVLLRPKMCCLGGTLITIFFATLVGGGGRLYMTCAQVSRWMDGADSQGGGTLTLAQFQLAING